MLGEQSRILRWARGSGSSVQDVLLLVEEYKRLAKVFQSECPEHTKAHDNAITSCQF